MCCLALCLLSLLSATGFFSDINSLVPIGGIIKLGELVPRVDYDGIAVSHRAYPRLPFKLTLAILGASGPCYIFYH